MEEVSERRGAEHTADLESALESMVYQFAYYGKGVMSTGGLSALEEAFEVLGWDDPHPMPERMQCYDESCAELATAGEKFPDGVYRRTCWTHRAAVWTPK